MPFDQHYLVASIAPRKVLIGSAALDKWADPLSEMLCCVAASDAFENTEMYTWMCENAEDYGFILRYPQSKQEVTGVIYESWHWRFVGINNAKEINKLGILKK